MGPGRFALASEMTRAVYSAARTTSIPTSDTGSPSVPAVRTRSSGVACNNLGSGNTLNVSSGPRLTVSRLSVERAGRLVLSDVSFEVRSGEALLVTGPNGAGKTTLLRTISGFVSPQAGEITLEGVEDPDTSLVENCHVVGHLNGIKPAMTVLENLAFWAAYLGSGAGSPPATLAGAIDRLMLSGLEDIPAGLLSAGQKRRLGLARLLIARRAVWLLDEPTASLDASSSRIVAELIDGHVASGGIALVVTHLPLGLAASRELALLPTATSSVVEEGMPP